MNEPTEKQINAIRKLARSTNTSIDVDSVATKQEASRILDELIAKQNGKSKNGSNDSRDRKIAYGMSVKLVFQRYQHSGSNYRTEEFWKEVDEFHKQYLEHQDRV
ncbi:hypothetical protein ACFL6S_07790 [Candidatus Poribacteria bacterium]